MPGPTGFVLGALADYIGQVGNNYFFKDKKVLSVAMTEDINLWSIGISGAVGAATGGIDAFKSIATSGVGKQIFRNMIDYGIDALVNTMSSVLADQLQEGDFDFWKSLTGGLIGAVPIKYVDKLQNKLLRKMGVQANKMQQAKNRLARRGLSQTRRQTAMKKYNDAAYAFGNYQDAYRGVKVVSEAFKSGGTSALTDALFMKEPQSKTPVIEIGKLDTGEIVK